jgi:hypothetical protein
VWSNKFEQREKKERKNNVIITGIGAIHKWKYREGNGRMVRKEDKGESECKGSIYDK